MVRLKHEMQTSVNLKTLLTARLRSSCGMCFGSKVIEVLFTIQLNSIECFCSQQLLVIHQSIQMIIEHDIIYQGMRSQRRINIGIMMLVRIIMQNHVHLLIKMML
jgi:hypothetical protein